MKRLFAVVIAALALACSADRSVAPIRASVQPLKGSGLYGGRWQIHTNNGWVQLSRLGDYLSGVNSIPCCSPSWAINASRSGVQEIIPSSWLHDDLHSFETIDSVTNDGVVKIHTVNGQNFIISPDGVTNHGFIKATFCAPDSTVKWTVTDTSGAQSTFLYTAFPTDTGALKYTVDDPKPQCYP